MTNEEACGLGASEVGMKTNNLHFPLSRFKYHWHAISLLAYAPEESTIKLYGTLAHQSSARKSVFFSSRHHHHRVPCTAACSKQQGKGALRSTSRSPHLCVVYMRERTPAPPTNSQQRNNNQQPTNKISINNTTIRQQQQKHQPATTQPTPKNYNDDDNDKR